MSIGTVAANKSDLIVLLLEPIRMLMRWVVRVCWSEDNTAHESHRDRPCVSDAVCHFRPRSHYSPGRLSPEINTDLQGGVKKEYRLRTVPSVKHITVLITVASYA